LGKLFEAFCAMSENVRLGQTQGPNLADRRFNFTRFENASL
jgi:hypothetical protein